MKTRCILIFVLSLFYLSSRSQVNSEPALSDAHQTVLPYNRIIRPAGLQVFFGDKSSENHSLDAALSPDRKWLAVEERYSIVFINTADKQIKFVLNNNSHADHMGGMNTYSGITWHNGKNGTEVYWSSIIRGTRSYVVSAKWDGTKAEFGRMIEYKTQAPAKLALPNEILISKEAEREFLYVVLNGNNKVLKQDFLTKEFYTI